MAQRKKHSMLRMFALAGAGFALFVCAAVVLAMVAVSLVAATRMVPRDLSPRAKQGADLALLMPTRTPTPGPTLSPTSEPPPATVMPAGDTALPQSTYAPSTPLPVADASSSAVIAIPFWAFQSAATPGAAAPSSASPPTEMLQPSETPVGAPGEAPSAAAAGTPVAEPGETPLPPVPPAAYGDLSDFETYLLDYRSSIAGQPLEIVALTMDTTNGATPRLVLQIAGGDTNSVFAAQPTAEVLEYGRLLLDDAKRYLGGEDGGIAVESTFSTSDTDACSSTPAWCQVLAYDQSSGTWIITWTYVRGSYAGGQDTIEAWDTGP